MSILPKGTPQGAQEDKRSNVPTGVAFTHEHPDIDDDSLPLDGSITFKDNEPENVGTLAEETRVLTGSEGTQTAGGAVDVSVVKPPEDMDQTANVMATES